MFYGLFSPPAPYYIPWCSSQNNFFGFLSRDSIDITTASMWNDLPSLGVGVDRVTWERGIPICQVTRHFPQGNQAARPEQDLCLSLQKILLHKYLKGRPVPVGSCCGVCGFWGALNLIMALRKSPALLPTVICSPECCNPPLVFFGSPYLRLPSSLNPISSSWSVCRNYIQFLHLLLVRTSLLVVTYC